MNRPYQLCRPNSPIQRPLRPPIYRSPFPPARAHLQPKTTTAATLHATSIAHTRSSSTLATTLRTRPPPRTEHPSSSSSLLPSLLPVPVHPLCHHPVFFLSSKKVDESLPDLKDVPPSTSEPPSLLARATARACRSASALAELEALGEDPLTREEGSPKDPGDLAEERKDGSRPLSPPSLLLASLSGPPVPPQVFSSAAQLSSLPLL